MIRILHIVCFPELYGTQRSLLSTAAGMDRSAFEPLVAAPANREFEAAVADAGAAFIPVAQRNLWDMDSVSALRRAIRVHNVDIIHCHLGISSFLGLLAARPLRIPAVVTRHFINDRYTTLANPMLRLGYLKTYQWMNREFARIICVSEAVRASVAARENVPLEKCVVIPNGVAVPDEEQIKRLKAEPRPGPLNNIPPNRKIVFCISRLVAEKGLDTLLSAAAECVNRGLDLCVVIAGHGPLRGDLDAQAVRLGIGNRVIFTGFVQNIPQYLSSADLFVLPALNEPFGVALIEAMAMGLPVAAAAAGGPLEIIEHGKTGLLFPPGDSAALAKTIEAALQSSERAASLAREARRGVMRFERNLVACRVEDVYRSVLNL